MHEDDRKSNKNDEIRKYYISIKKKDEQEIMSDLSEKKFNLWDIIENHRKKLNIGKKLLDIGSGLGNFAIDAYSKDYNVFIIDILEEFIKEITTNQPELKRKAFLVDIFNEEDVSNFINEQNQFDVITVLGSVPNHAKDKMELERCLFNITKLGKTNSLFVIDFLQQEMFPESPSVIWSDYKHYLASFHDIAGFLQIYGLRVLDLYSIHEPYSEKPNSYEEHSIRFFLHKPC
ncbi:MAG: class I SAM-dependent methyltransferase [Candidatus Hodarchaeales archaeon]